MKPHIRKRNGVWVASLRQSNTPRDLTALGSTPLLAQVALMELCVMKYAHSIQMLQAQNRPMFSSLRDWNGK
jgi:secreted protein with Ig-like and vWFA domain